jgi:UDP-glucose 4-epimerase
MIVVVGATGYIGRYLCTQLIHEGKNVLALGRSQAVKDFFAKNKVPFKYFDFNDTSSFNNLPKKGVDVVVNLAAMLAELEPPVEKYFDINTLGTQKLLEYCRQNDIPKFILSSTHKVYSAKNSVCIKETDAPVFKGSHSPYTISKIAAENFVQYYHSDYGIHGLILRLTGVHGYGEILGQLKPDASYQKSTFEIFVEQAINSEPIEVWGDTSVVRDHIYIKDVVSSISAAIESKKAVGIFNIATGEGISLLEEAQTIADVFSPPGKKSEIVLKPGQQGLDRNYVYVIDKAKNELNWQPKYSYREMIEDYYQEWLIKKYRHYHRIKEGQEPVTL